MPTKFHDPERYNPGRVAPEVFEQVPGVVASAIFNAIDADVVLDPGVVFLYLKQGLLPQFVVAYFMDLQGTRRKISKGTRFFRALYLVHLFREHVILPPPHFLSDFDTASVLAVGRLAGEDGGSGVPSSGKQPDDPEGKVKIVAFEAATGEEEEQEEKEKKEEGSDGSGKKKEDGSKEVDES